MDFFASFVERDLVDAFFCVGRDREGCCERGECKQEKVSWDDHCGELSCWDLSVGLGERSSGAYEIDWRLFKKT